MENNAKSALNSDVYFLIQRFLSSGLLNKTLKVFNEELEQHNILPRRVDWEGKEHERTVEDMIDQFPNIRPDYLLHLCCQATNPSGYNNSLYQNGTSAIKSTSFLSFKPNYYIRDDILTNFRQYFNYLTRSHGAPIQRIDAPFNIVNSLRGREVSGPFSRLRAISPKIYKSLQIQRTTVGHLSAVYCLLFDHAGKYIVTGADDLLIKLWSAHTGRLIAVFRGASSEITDIAINSENTLLAAGSIDRIIRVWNLQTGYPVAVLTGHNGMITSVNFCPTPCWGVRYLISTSTDGSIAFWTYTYDSAVKVEFRKTPILYQEKIRPGQAQMICSSFSPGGTFLATGSADHHVRVYYMKGDEGPHRILEMEAHSDRVDSIQWAHSGLRFLSGSKDGMAIIWWFERQQWKSLILNMAMKLPSATNVPETDTKKLKVTMVCWNKSDSWVVTAVSDFTLKIWTASDGQLIKVLPGHTDEIYVLEGHPCDNYIILSAGHDGQLFVWDILKGEIVFRFLNTIEGQGFSALFDVKWSPDGCIIAGSDSHGHIHTFGFGNVPYFEQLPKELFFHTDYRPLVRDSNHYVLDEQTQIPPHLMPPPFLVDIDGNPYPPMLQRLVPGRELCNVEQLIPNIVIGNEGTQEVIQDIPQNHVVDLEHDEDEDLREPGFRPGRRHSNRDHERIRQSTGNWQSDPNIEWKKNVLVQPLKKAVLDRAKQIREALKNAELEEYQKQLRQRPHMISINTSSNIKKEEKKKRNVKYATRSFKKYQYKEDEPESSGNENLSESSGSSDWVEEEKPERPKRSNRRHTVNHVRYSEREDDVDDDDDYENDHDYGEGPSSSRGRENHVNRRKENHVMKPKENNASRSKDTRNNHKSNNVIMSSDDEDHYTQTTENHLGKAKLIIRLSKTTADDVTYTATPSTSSSIHNNSKLKVSEQYRLNEWLSETRPRKSPYYPQLGDEIVYFMQGHQLYLNAVEIKKIYEISIKELPWYKMTIRDHEFAKVIGIQYEMKPPRLCCLKLALLDECGRLTGKGFTVKYHDMPDVLDFLVLKQMYNTAMSRNWQTGDKFRCMIDDEWWIGHIMNKSPASENFPDSAFLCYEIKWTNGEHERMSPWDMEPIDLERLPEDENQAVPVLDQELASILYKTVECDWPYNDLTAITTHIVTGITNVMELAHAEPFLVPVDINVYPEYAIIIEYPIDLSTIKARFENHFYRRLTAAQFDIRYLAINAEKFNVKHSAIVKHSRIVTELCLRIVKGCSDYIDVPSLYRRLVDTYNSYDSEEELDVPTSINKNICSSVRRIKRHTNDWKKEAIDIVENLWKSEDSEPFREPVDPQTYPDYYNIVKNPMDLGTVRENLKNNEYDVPQKFIIDMRLIFQNSRLYTPNKKSVIYYMTVRLCDMFEEQSKRLMPNWRIARRRQKRRESNSSNEDEVSISSSSSSDEEVLSKLTSGSQEEVDSELEDDMPLNILRSKTNTESDTASQSTFNRIVKSVKNYGCSEDEYSPSAEYSRSSRKTKYKSTTEEELDKDSSSSDEGKSPKRKCNLRQRPTRKKVLLYKSSDSEASASTNKKKRIKKNFDSDTDSKSSHNTLPSVNKEGSFISEVSSRGRVRKLTERAKALFKKR
ncbi:hypothetical protein JTB14_024785 [Gonioctena quinquepunctata]|nr:hypothetical protein JTB14_024785 [Gonioctena quinquepunctata]